MRLGIGDKAPYAPGQVIVDLIRRQRQSGTLKVVDSLLLDRLGVPESLRPRTLASLRQLGLIDDTGSVTEIMEAFKRGSEEEYRARLAEFLRSVYGEVFDVIGDPASASTDEVETAFRGFEPHGQRSRMVVLFLSLCQEAGLVNEVVRDRPSSVGRTERRVQAKRPKSPGTAVDPVGVARSTPAAPTPAPVLGEMDPLLAAYFAKLPGSGTTWPKAERERYLVALGSIFDIVYEEAP